MLVLVVLLTVVMAIMVVLVAGLLRSHADILRSLHDLGIGEDGPGNTDTFRTQAGVPTPRDASGESGAADISGQTATGASKVVAVGEVNHTTLLAFLSSGCLTCRDFWDAFAEPLRLPGTDTRLVIVTQGPDKESPAGVQALQPPGVTTIMSSQAWDDYGVPVAPYFLLIDGPTGTVVGEGAAASWAQVERLLGQALADTGRAGNAKPTPMARASGAARAAAADDALLAAGITPGHPDLYHDQREQER